MSSSLPFERLSVGHALLPFDCGDEDINDFFVSQAMHYQKELLAVTYFLEDGENTVFYFTLSNDKVTALELSKGFWRKIKALFPHSKHRKDYPAVKIGRLAVSMTYKGQGIGTDIVSAVKQMLINNHSISACRFLTVDAYKEAYPFYIKNGFKPLVNDMEEDTFTIPMYYDLKELAL